jgi:hypothetical protein
MDGTLVLVLRSCIPWSDFDGFLDSNRSQIVDRHGVLIIGGLAFVEGIHEGIDIGDSDPTYRIEQMCLAFARKDYDHSVFDLDSHLADRAQQKARKEELRQKINEIALPILGEHLDEYQVGAFVTGVMVSIKGPIEDLSAYVLDKATKAVERELARKRAAEKARAILREHLDEAQVAEFDATGEFHVQGADGYIYLITNQVQHNVFRIEDGRRTREYCVVTKAYVPTHDQMLAQMLLLQCNPEMFHSIANTWHITEENKRVFQPRADPPDVN